jgi:hypothetical protein
MLMTDHTQLARTGNLEANRLARDLRFRITATIIGITPAGITKEAAAVVRGGGA